jgi:hypothetical protein
MAVQEAVTADNATGVAQTRFSSPCARVLVITGLAVTAVAHVPVAVQHMVEVPYLGWAFYLFVIAAAAGLGSILVEDRAVVWAGILALNVSAVVAFLVSRSIGLPAAGDDRGDWSNPLGITSVVAELTVIAVTVVVLTRWRSTRRR